MLRTLAVTATLGLLSALQGQARVFNNPILDSDNPDPGAILVDGVYYITATSSGNPPQKFPIYTSTDLNSWTLRGYAFTDGVNMPVWSNRDQPFWAPEIHRVGNDFRLYFTSRDVASNHLSIGAATAPTPLGPWTALDRPLWLDPAGDVLDSTLVNDNGNLYLLWKGGVSIKGRPLNPDGLSFSSDQVTEIFRNELPWEDTIVEAPWYVRRDQYHYLFYSGHDYCSDLYRVGVARSAFGPLGPYEKRGDPILASNAAFQGPGHNSIVKDTDGQGDVMVFHSFRAGQVCGPNPRLTLLASVGWGPDQWPYVFDF